MNALRNALSNILTAAKVVYVVVCFGIAWLVVCFVVAIIRLFVG